MKLGQILRSRNQPIAPRPVTFWVVGRDEHLRETKAKATAVLVYVDEDKREQLRIEALSDLRKRFPDKIIPEAVVHDEIIYRTLFEALRDEDASDAGIYLRFAETLVELRSALVKEEADRLDEEYGNYVIEEFPAAISDEDFAKLVDEGKKNSMSALLTSCGYENAVRVLSFLAGRRSK